LKIIFAIVFIITLSSCQIQLTGVNKFSQVYKGMHKNEVFKKVKQRPDFARQLNFMNDIMFYEVYNIKLSTYKREYREREESLNPRIKYIEYDATEITDYFFPYIILYKDGLVYYQGFIWEYKNDPRIEINELAVILWSQIYG
jgi:hypothetical protein